MTNYNKWDIVLVPFPFTDLSSIKKRPALILSPDKYNALDDIIIAFITSNIQGEDRFGDYLIEQWKQAGLPLPSKFRMKFATVSKDIIIKKIGHIEKTDQMNISKLVQDFFG
jgi:mRNA interferase MazF